MALFASLTLALTAGFIYAFNLALLPDTPLDQTFRAQRQCSGAFDQASAEWNACVLRERRPPADGPIRFLLPSAGGAGAGIALVVLSARFRARTVLPAVALTAIVAAGTAFALRERDRSLERLRAVPVSASPAPPASPTP